MIDLTPLDRKVLNRVQKDFPMTVCPYADIAKAIDASEKEVMDIIRRMKTAGIIRRIGGIFDTRRMGFYSTLCAAKTPEDRIESAAALINKEAGVTHNYLRDNQMFNLWFTLTASSRNELEATLQGLRQKTGLAIVSLPAAKVFKINVFFEMGDGD